MKTYGQGPMEDHRLNLKLSARARLALLKHGQFSLPRPAGVVLAAGVYAILGASKARTFREAVDMAAAPASVTDEQVEYPSETDGVREALPGGGYIRTGIPSDRSLYMATFHRQHFADAVRLVVRAHSSVFADAERLAADHRQPVHLVRTCALELGVARAYEAVEGKAELSLSLRALADHLGVTL